MAIQDAITKMHIIQASKQHFECACYSQVSLVDKRRKKDEKMSFSHVCDFILTLEYGHFLVI